MNKESHILNHYQRESIKRLVESRVSDKSRRGEVDQEQQRKEPQNEKIL
jgi:hypothetical protein